VAYEVGNLTTAAQSVALQVTTGRKAVRVTITGTYTGLTGKVQGSNDGTNYVDLTGLREDTAGLVSGTFSVSAANVAVGVASVGWRYVQFLVSAISSGTAAVRVEDSAGSVADMLPVQPLALTYIQSAVTAATANALAVGPNGTTNPTFTVDTSAGSCATGLKVTGAAAAGGVAVAAVSSGTNESVTLDAKGSGTLTLQGTATGAITLTTATGVSAALTVTSTSASALTVGAAGATNPVLKVNANTASQATGLHITGAAAAGGLAVAVISSGTNEALTINAKGSGTITIGGVSTGNVNLGGGGGVVVLPGTLTAGGLLTCALQVATSGPLIYSGSGAPTISAAVKGSLYLRSDGGATNTRAYIATDTAGTWTPLTTAA
jgi:hypothetical protein